MKNLLDVSIIIVNYNTKDFTRNCLKSVFEQTKDISFEVIVSDNGSTDGSVEMIKSEFPQVIFIENNENLGFGAANNRGLKIAKGKYIFYLNSDTVLLNNAVKIFFDYWENSPEKEKIGALGCVLQDDKGNLIHSGGEFPKYSTICRERFSETVHSYAKYLLLKFHLERLCLSARKQIKSECLILGEVDYVTGADLFMFNDRFAKFDERFILYYEETDLQKNLRKMTGKKAFLISEPKIIHLLHKGRTEKIKFETFSTFHNKVSSVLYFKKYGKKARALNFFNKIIFLLPPNKKWRDKNLNK